MWRVSKIQDLDYEILHRNGKDNEEADTVSRHPMSGKRSLLRVGADIATNELLKSLPASSKEIDR